MGIEHILKKILERERFDPPTSAGQALDGFERAWTQLGERFGVGHRYLDSCLEILAAPLAALAKDPEAARAAALATQRPRIAKRAVAGELDGPDHGAEALLALALMAKGRAKKDAVSILCRAWASQIVDDFHTRGGADGFSKALLASSDDSEPGSFSRSLSASDKSGRAWLLAEWSRWGQSSNNPRLRQEYQQDFVHDLADLCSEAAIGAKACGAPAISALQSTGTQCLRHGFKISRRARGCASFVAGLAAELAKKPFGVRLDEILGPKECSERPVASSVAAAAANSPERLVALLRLAERQDLLGPSSWSGPWKGPHPLFLLCGPRPQGHRELYSEAIELLSARGYGADWSLPAGFAGQAENPAAQAEPHFLHQWLKSNSHTLKAATLAAVAAKIDFNVLNLRGETALGALNRRAKSDPSELDASEAIELALARSATLELFEHREATEVASTPAIAALVAAESERRALASNIDLDLWEACMEQARKELAASTPKPRAGRL